MAKKNFTVDIKIIDWFVKWWGKDNNHTVCLLVDINGKLQLIERELEQE